MVHAFISNEFWRTSNKDKIYSKEKRFNFFLFVTSLSMCPQPHTRLTGLRPQKLRRAARAFNGLWKHYFYRYYCWEVPWRNLWCGFYRTSLADSGYSHVIFVILLYPENIYFLNFFVNIPCMAETCWLILWVDTSFSSHLSTKGPRIRILKM